jgi:hypothetical protein
VPIVLKSGSLNLLEPSGLIKACNGIALALSSFFPYLPAHSAGQSSYLCCGMTEQTCKAIPIQPSTGSYRSGILRLPGSLDLWHMKVASMSAIRTGDLHPPGDMVLISVRGWVDPRAIVRPEWLRQQKFADPIVNQTCYLPTCSVVKYVLVCLIDFKWCGQNNVAFIVGTNLKFCLRNDQASNNTGQMASEPHVNRHAPKHGIGLLLPRPWRWVGKIDITAKSARSLH